MKCVNKLILKVPTNAEPSCSNLQTQISFRKERSGSGRPYSLTLINK